MDSPPKSTRKLCLIALASSSLASTYAFAATSLATSVNAVEQGFDSIITLIKNGPQNDQVFCDIVASDVDALRRALNSLLTYVVPWAEIWPAMSPTFPEFTKYLQDESLTIESLYSQPNTRVLFKASDVSNVDFTNIEHLFLVGGNDPTSLNIRNRTKLKTLGFFDGGGLSSTMREDVLHLVKNAALSNLIVSRWGDTNLAANTFLDATGLVQIIMSDVVTTECSIFTRCRNLVKAVFPNATSMSNDVFNNCSNLKTIYFPRLRSMGAYAFQECKELEEVSFPALESIPGGFALGGNVSVATFGMCSKLTKGYFPVVQTIGEYAFGGCLRFANREFPRAESIASTAFAGCP